MNLRHFLIVLGLALSPAVVAAGLDAWTHRLQYEGFAGEEMELPVHQICTTQEVELVIDNGDSPPLRIDRIEASRHAVPIVFQADVPGAWRLYMGNAQDPAPRYDVAALGGALRQATAMAVVAGAVELNPDFRKTATAPEVGGTGAAIDVSAWSFPRRKRPACSACRARRPPCAIPFYRYRNPTRA